MSRFFNSSEKINLLISHAANVETHEHDFLEFVYVLEGSVKHVIKNKEFIIKKGNYFIIDYNTPHSYESLGKKEFSIVNCLFLPEFIDKTLRKCTRFSEVAENYLIHCSHGPVAINPANHIFLDDDRKIENIIQKMKLEFFNKNIGYIEVLRCYLIEMIILTSRKIQAENEMTFNSVEKYIADYIRENYMNKIYLADVAKKLNYSVPYLSKLFHGAYGITFEKYLQKIRIEDSCRLLANTDKKIIEIAECVGYYDLKFFNVIFKRNMGMTPREYRRLYR